MNRLTFTQKRLLEYISEPIHRMDGNGILGGAFRCTCELLRNAWTGFGAPYLLTRDGCFGSLPVDHGWRSVAKGGRAVKTAARVLRCLSS